MNLRFRRHAALVGLSLVIVATLVLGLSNTRIISYSLNSKPAATEVTLRNVANAQALFDDSIVHRIQIIMPKASYEMMLNTFQYAQEKDFFEADIIIDEVRINKIGIRLKGNASLSTAMSSQNQAKNAANGPPGGFGGGPPGGGNGDGCFATNGGGAGGPAGMPKPQAGQGPPAGMPKPEFGGFGGENDATVPVAVPYLIKFDEFVKGQRYQGYRSLSIRNYGIARDASALHEPLTYYAARLTGMPAPATAYAGVRINDDAEKFYSLSELVDEDYLAKYFSNRNGVLYKAEIGASMKYNGEAPENYTGCYGQKTRIKDADIRPVIELIRFVNQADDATFERDLDKYLDINSLVNYLALNNLLVNTDSLAGMGNNYYLYYDNQSKRFSVLLWDANESLGKLAGGASAATYNLYYENGNANNAGEGQAQQFQAGPPMMNGDNVLKKRFLANPNFRKRYEAALSKQYQQIFGNDAFTPKIAAYSALIHGSNPNRALVNLDSYDKAAAKVQSFLTARKDYVQQNLKMTE